MGAKSCIWMALLFRITRNALFIINTESTSVWFVVAVGQNFPVAGSPLRQGSKLDSDSSLKL